MSGTDEEQADTETGTAERPHFMYVVYDQGARRIKDRAYRIATMSEMHPLGANKERLT